MEICFKIEVHFYLAEQLFDEILDDDFDSRGILGPELILPLRKNRNCTLQYQYTMATTIGEAIQAIIQRVEGANTENYVVSDDCVNFLHGTERYQIADTALNLRNLIEKYLDSHKTGNIRVQILNCADAGGICYEDGIRYYMHSHEAGKHNEPHVHVEDTGHNYEASIALSDGRILAGEFPRKLLKKAQKKIYEDNAYFFECWQAKTDGLIPDINHHYGYIKY